MSETGFVLRNSNCLLSLIVVGCRLSLYEDDGMGVGCVESL